MIRASSNKSFVDPSLNISFVPHAPLLMKPAKFRRIQDVYITTALQFDPRARPSSISYNWTLFSCSTTCSNQLFLNLPSNKELFIRSQTLGIGIYQCQLTVMIIINSSMFSSVESIYLEIVDSNIVTKLIEIDQSIIKHDSRKDLVLNPGEYSFDPDRITFNSHVSFAINEHIRMCVYCLIEGMELSILLSSVSLE